MAEAGHLGRPHVALSATSLRGKRPGSLRGFPSPEGYWSLSRHGRGALVCRLRRGSSTIPAWPGIKSWSRCASSRWRPEWSLRIRGLRLGHRRHPPRCLGQQPGYGRNSGKARCADRHDDRQREHAARAAVGHARCCHGGQGPGGGRCGRRGRRGPHPRGGRAGAGRHGGPGPGPGARDRTSGIGQGQVLRRRPAQARIRAHPVQHRCRHARQRQPVHGDLQPEQGPAPAQRPAAGRSAFCGAGLDTPAPPGRVRAWRAFRTVAHRGESHRTGGTPAPAP